MCLSLICLKHHLNTSLHWRPKRWFKLSGFLGLQSVPKIWGHSTKNPSCYQHFGLLVTPVTLQMSGWNFCPELNPMPQCCVLQQMQTSSQGFQDHWCVCEYRALSGTQLEAWALRNPLLLAETKPAGSFQPLWKGKESLKDFSSSTAKLCSWKL